MPFSARELTSIAAQCQRVARHFGDRCNGPSEITEGEATSIVRACLNAGNMLETLAREMGSAPEPAAPQPLPGPGQ